MRLSLTLTGRFYTRGNINNVYFLLCHSSHTWFKQVSPNWRFWIWFLFQLSSPQLTLLSSCSVTVPPPPQFRSTQGEIHIFILAFKALLSTFSAWLLFISKEIIGISFWQIGFLSCSLNLISCIWFCNLMPRIRMQFTNELFGQEFLFLGLPWRLRW